MGTMDTGQVWCPRVKFGQRVFLKTLSNELLIMIFDFHADLGKNADVNPDLYKKGIHGRYSELSRVDKHFRALCLVKLFRPMRLRSDEDELRLLIDEVLGCPDLLPVVRALNINSDRRYPRFGRMHPSIPNSQMQLMMSMPNLTELYLDHDSGQRSIISRLRLYMARHNVSFPAMKKLKFKTSANIRFLLYACPNLEVLGLWVISSPQATRGLDAIQSLPKLKALNLCRSSGAWRIIDVEQLLTLCPDVPYLLLEGGLAFSRLEQFVVPFTGFNKLEHLAISDKKQRKVRPAEYAWEPRFGQDMHAVAKAFFTQCSGLKSICIERPSESKVFEPRHEQAWQLWASEVRGTNDGRTDQKYWFNGWPSLTAFDH